MLRLFTIYFLLSCRLPFFSFSQTLKIKFNFIELRSDFFYLIHVLIIIIKTNLYIFLHQDCEKGIHSLSGQHLAAKQGEPHEHNTNSYWPFIFSYITLTASWMLLQSFRGRIFCNRYFLMTQLKWFSRKIFDCFPFYRIVNCICFLFCFHKHTFLYICVYSVKFIVLTHIFHFFFEGEVVSSYL